MMEKLMEALDRAGEACGRGTNAFITLYDQDEVREMALAIRKRQEARDPSLGPLAGVPIAVKDNICTKGIRTTCGSRILENFVPPYQATVMDRLERAGVIPIGKTNMDEFGMGSTSETSYFGAVKNPLDESRVPGGSSGGSAVAVASGIVPIALGTDTGGSVRQPAAHCGIYGLKPTYGAVSRYGLVAYASSMDQIGPLAGSLSDLEALYVIIAGPDEKDSSSSHSCPEVCDSHGRDVFSTNVEGLRIGIPKEFFSAPEKTGYSVFGLDMNLSTSVDNRICERVLQVSSVLESRGATVEYFDLDGVEYAVPAYYVIACAEASSNLERYDGVKYGYRSESYSDLHDMYRRTRSEGFGEEVRRRLMLGTFVLSHGYYDAYYLQACRVRERIRREFRKVWERFDVILSPVTPTVAPKLGESLPDPIRMYLSDLYTVPANLTGNPAIVFPCGEVDDLPVGAQLIADHFCEKKLFKVVAAYEK